MDQAASPIVIVGSIAAEVAVFADQLADRTASAIRGLPCWRGTLQGHPCVLAEMGMGKTNAAMTTTLLLTHLQPRMVICAGGSGGLNPTLQWGDTIIVEKTIHHDYGALRPDGMTRWPTLNPIAGDENPLYLPTDTTLTTLAISTVQHLVLPTIRTRVGKRTPRIRPGVLATGDIFVTDPQTRRKLWQSLHADVIDMEGAAVVQTARQFGVAGVVIRSISDVDEHVDADWETYFGSAVRNAACVVTGMIAGLDK